MEMVLKILVLLVLVLLIAGAIYLFEYLGTDYSNKDTMSFRETMDLTELPIITFYSGDTKLNLILDTGSNISHLNKSIQGKLNICKSEMSNATITGIAGAVTNVPFAKVLLKYKDKEFSEDFAIHDLDSQFNRIKEESGAQVHGILGNRFFQKYKYVLNFDELIAYSKV